MKKNPIYPLHLGGVWMVGVRGYIGLQICLKLQWSYRLLARDKRSYCLQDDATIKPMDVQCCKHGW